MAAEVVLVEFQVDYSQLDNALDTLEKSGAIDSRLAQNYKKTTQEITKQAAETKKAAAAQDQNSKALNKTVSSFKGIQDAGGKTIKTLADLDKASRTFVEEFIEGFTEGVQAELIAAKDELDKFKQKYVDTTTKATEPTKSLKKELKELVQTIATAKANGGPVDPQMIARAGELKDAIADANAEIANAGSDTRGLDNLVGTVQTLAAGYAIAQGASALFGDESEETQKALLKVNAAMAILQGLQQIQNALQKEGAVTLAIENAQRTIRNAQQSLAIALESKYIAVRGLATIAQKALNVAMNANPIGIIVTALATVIPLMIAYTNNAKKVAAAQEGLNSAMSALTDNLNAEIIGLTNANERYLTDLRETGETQGNIAKAEIANIQLIQEARRRAIRDAEEELAKTEGSRNKDVIAKREELKAEIIRITNEGVQANVEIYQKEAEARRLATEEQIKSQIGATSAALQVVADGSKKQLNLQKQLAIQERNLALLQAGLTAGEKLKIQADTNEKLLQLDADYNARQATGRIAALNNQLINVEKNTQDEFKLRSRLIAENATLELAAINLSEQEKKNIRDKAFQEQIMLQREYTKAITEAAIADEIARNQAVLAQRNISDADRLNSTIANIELAAAAEVVAAEGNTAKIKEIYARRDLEIRNAKKALILETAKYELDLETAIDGRRKRALEREVSDVRTSMRNRVIAMQELASIQLRNIDKELSDTQRLYDEKLISQKEYNLKVAQLEDQRAAVIEETNVKVAALTRDAYIMMANETLSAISSIGQGLQNIASEQQTNSQITIENKRKEVQELLEAGAITEKDAIERQKKIDREDRVLKTRAAKQAKDFAIFNAIIQTAQGVAAAIARAELFPFNFVLAGIVGALGAAQVAAISARPIPKFAKGKKDGYEGFGIMGEAGAELKQNADGSMYVAAKPTVVWVGSRDKIYTAKETSEILSDKKPKVVKAWQQEQAQSMQKSDFDYEALGKVLAGAIKMPSSTNVTIDKDFISEQVGNALGKVVNLDRYYSSRR